MGGLFVCFCDAFHLEETDYLLFFPFLRRGWANAVLALCIVGIFLDLEKKTLCVHRSLT